VIPVARAAAARRQGMDIPPATDVLRLVDDAADGCPGLVVDRYGPVLRLELRGRRWPAEASALANALCDEARVPHAVGLLRLAGGKSEMKVLRGDPPAAHVVHEAGVRLLVRTVDREAAGAGVFVDHRLGRALVRARSRGAVVLNLFAHAGAFGAVAAAGGAARVDHVDAARKCAPWAALNLALNGHDPRRHRFLVDDALAVLAKAVRRAGRAGRAAEAASARTAALHDALHDPLYDLVVCDPPTTAVRPDGSRFHVEKHLGELAASCLTILRPGGALLLSTNNRALTVDDVASCARAGAAAAGRALRSVDEVPLPPDVASAADRELRPMRGVLAVISSSA
jgi:23S rRNA (cytosine1962-C5)-methyltransferase